MKLEKTIIEVEVYGQKFELKKPNFKQSQAYREELLKADSDVAKCMKDYLEILGMPAGLFEELEVDHITQIMDLVSSVKKN